MYPPINAAGIAPRLSTKKSFLSKNLFRMYRKLAYADTAIFKVSAVGLIMVAGRLNKVITAIYADEPAWPTDV